MNGYDFQNFNLIRRIARELFVNGYRSYDKFINLPKGRYNARIKKIIACLEKQMPPAENENAGLTNHALRIRTNPFYSLMKSRSMKPTHLAVYFTVLDMLSNGGAMSLAEIARQIDYHVLPEEILSPSSVDDENRLRRFLVSCSTGDHPFVVGLDNGYRLNTGMSKREIREILIPTYYADSSAMAYALLRVMPTGQVMRFDEIRSALREDIAAHPHYALPGFEGNGGNATLHGILRGFRDDGLLAFNPADGTYALPSVRFSDLLARFPSLPAMIAFFSEYSPLGVVGSFIMDEHDLENKSFIFKNHHIQKALDSIVLYDLLCAIQDRTCLSIYAEQSSDTVLVKTDIIPIKILVRTGEGRQFLFMYDITHRKYTSARLDNIYYVEKMDPETATDGLDIDARIEEGVKQLAYVWGSGIGIYGNPCSVSAKFINDRPFMFGNLTRESRNGSVRMLDDDEIQFDIKTYRPLDLAPWLLGYTGKISAIQTSKKDPSRLITRLVRHINGLHEIYQGDAERQYSQKMVRYTPISADELRKYENTHRSDRSALFQPHHGKYVSCLRAILEKLREPHTKPEIVEIIEAEKARFGISKEDDELSFDRLAGKMDPDTGDDNGNGLIKRYSDYRYYSGQGAAAVDPDRYCANLHGSTLELPLDTLERRWLATIISDDLCSLFLSSDEIHALRRILKDARPLYRPNDILYIDQYKDHDPYDSPDYSGVFATICKAIDREMPELQIIYQTEQEKRAGVAGTTYTVHPKAIEYNLQSNRMILLAVQPLNAPRGALNERRDSGCLYARLSNIERAAIVENPTSSIKVRYVEEAGETPITIRLLNIYNAFDRFQNMFSSYIKKTTPIAPVVSINKKGECNSVDACVVNIWYSNRDVKEVMLKLRTFGEAVEVLEPKEIRKDFAERVKKQYDLFVQIGLIHPDDDKPKNGGS